MRGRAPARLAAAVVDAGAGEAADVEAAEDRARPWVRPKAGAKQAEKLQDPMLNDPPNLMKDPATPLNLIVTSRKYAHGNTEALVS